MESDWADFIFYIAYIVVLTTSFSLPAGIVTGLLAWIARRLHSQSGREIMTMFVILSGIAFLALMPLIEWTGIFLHQLLVNVCFDHQGLAQFLRQEPWLFDMRELFRYARFLWGFLGWLFVVWGMVIGWMICKGVSLRVVKCQSVRSKRGWPLILLAWLITGGGLVILFFTTVGG